MSKLWSDLVRGLDPYVPGEQPKILDLVKLNTNENPYPPTPKVSDTLSQYDSGLLRLYPDPSSEKLKNALAENLAVNADQVFVGNGSDEVLAHAFVAFFKKEKPILFPDISYSFYPVYCNLFDIEFEQVALSADFSIDATLYEKPSGGIVFPNPNAPTGIFLGLECVENLAQYHSDQVVIVDEAYIDFGGESAVSLIDKYPNILVVQTFSKSRSLAGLRLGYAIGNSGLIAALERVKNSFNSYPVDRVAEVVAMASLGDKPYFDACCDKVVATRESLITSLKGLSFEVLPSAANFVFAKPLVLSAAVVFEKLREKNILVRYFNKPRISDYLRITIGSDDEMKLLISALEEIVAE